MIDFRTLAICSIENFKLYLNGLLTKYPSITFNKLIEFSRTCFFVRGEVIKLLSRYLL